jgi:hypothetical protein
MAWFLHAVELADGSWMCRHGLHEYDAHPSLELALSHLHELARELGSSELILHHLDGHLTRASSTSW